MATPSSKYRVVWVIVLVAICMWQMVFGFAAYYWPQTNLPAYAFWAFAFLVILFAYTSLGIFLVSATLGAVAFFYVFHLILEPSGHSTPAWVYISQIASVAASVLCSHFRNLDEKAYD